MNDGDESGSFFLEGMRRNCREDGRERTAFRRVICESGAVQHALGSAQVSIGKTKVLAAASLELGSPREGRPNSAVLNVSVDCTLSCSVSGNNWRQYDKHGEDLAKDIEHLYQGTQGSAVGILDKDNTLCISEGQSVWVFQVDLVVLNDEGSLLDALSIACRQSLRDLHMPKFEVLESNEVGPSGPDISIDEDPNHFWKLDCSSFPIYISVGVVDLKGQHSQEKDGSGNGNIHADGDGSCWVFDLSRREEAELRNTSLCFGVTRGGAIKKVMSRGSSSGMHYKSMENVIEAATRAGKVLLNSLDNLKVEEYAEDGEYFHIGR
jgi:exosome complex RNA-binding protein Rrp42 (RNase PH superfamily)